MQAAILCGGLGTRIAKVAGGVPKSLIPIFKELTFLDILITSLERSGVDEIVLCEGYLHDQITTHIQKVWQANTAIFFKFAREYEPLGTGGAVKNALDLLEDSFLLMNGDSYAQFDLPAFMENHIRKGKSISMLVKKVQNSTRYGSVVLGNENIVTGFGEKMGAGEGFINVGVYALTKSRIDWSAFNNVFSFERDLLPMMCKQGQIGAFITSGYFIDIGIPEDLAKFRSDFNMGFEMGLQR